MKFDTPIITAIELKENIHLDNLIILDCTIDKVGQTLKK